MFVINPVASDRGVSDLLVGGRVRDGLRNWVTPPNPSTNHNISCSIQHRGTVLWFLQSEVFREWKSTGSLFWIYGKRTVLPLLPNPLLMTIRIFSGLWEKHSLVGHRFALYPMTNSRYLIALRLFRTSKPYTRRGWLLLPTFILTLGILISKIVETSSHLSSSNSPRSPVHVVTSSTAFIWNMTKDQKHLAKLH